MSKLTAALKNKFRKYSKKLLVSLKRDFIYDRYTYQDIYDYSLKFITLLKENGIKKGERIAICSYNCPQYFYSFLGCVFSGVVLVPIDFGSSEELIRRFMEETECRLLITSKNKNIQTDLKKYYVEDLDEELKNKKKAAAEKNIKESALVEILYTSGTTGDPKGVMLTHENLYSNIASTVQVVEFEEYSLISMLPLSHLYEQVAGFIALTFAGARITHIKTRRPSEIIKVMQKEKVNALTTVPAFFILFKRKIEERAKQEGTYKKLQKALALSQRLPMSARRLLFRRIHLLFGGSLIKVLNGAAALPEDVELFWESLGIKVLNGYGMTETSPVLTITRENFRKIGSVGQPIPGVRIKIDKNKEILASGRNITQGYYRNKKATRELFKGKWLRTGDIGEFDEDGHLYIKGRLKNMILKPDGFNVYPEDIEKILDNNPLVKESCVVGITKSHDVIITAVLLMEKELDKRSVENIIEEANSKLEIHQRIQDYIVWKKKDFPRTLTLKVIRRKIINEIETQAYDAEECRDDLLQILSELSHVPAGKIREASRLYRDLGFDSLKMIELSNLIETRFDTDIQEGKIDSKTTVKKLRKLIRKGRTANYGNLLDEKMFWPVFRPFKIILPELGYFIFSWMFTSFEVVGRENFSKVKGQVILAPNHTSRMDIYPIVKVIPNHIRVKLGAAAASDAHFKKYKNRLLNFIYCKFVTLFLGMFPVEREGVGKAGKSTRQTFQMIGEILDRGWSLIMAPEGYVSPDGKLKPFRHGLSKVVHETKLPVILIKLEGMHEIAPWGHKGIVKKRGPIKLKVSEPLYFKEESIPEITEKLEKKMKEM